MFCTKMRTTMLIAVMALGLASAANTSAQYAPGVKEMLAGSKSPKMQRLTGVVRVRKDFGVVPMGPGHAKAAVYPCMPFRIAVYDAKSINSKPLAVSDGMMKQGLDDGDFYTCRYEVMVPAERGLYAVPVMGGTLRGWERGFAGKYVTLGAAKATYLKFDLIYAQVDPN